MKKKFPFDELSLFPPIGSCEECVGQKAKIILENGEEWHVLCPLCFEGLCASMIRSNKKAYFEFLGTPEGWEVYKLV